MESDVSAWTVVSDPSLQSGDWEQADPNGTIFNGDLAAPDDDATPGFGNIMAFVTQNCEGDECMNAGDSDIDGGPTFLISPMLDLAGLDSTIRYTRWFYTDSSGGEDLLKTEVSNDGGANWVLVHATEGTDSSWETVEFLVNEYVTPTANVRVRFTAADVLPVSIAEAGIDDFAVEWFVCEPAECVPDLDGNGAVGAFDLALLLGAWGLCEEAWGLCEEPCEPGDPSPACAADLSGDCEVGAFDLALLLGAWGVCP